MAHVIFLYGASSSGKSTIAKALQKRIENPFWHISIDHLRDAGVLPTERFKSGEFLWSDALSEISRPYMSANGMTLNSKQKMALTQILKSYSSPGDRAVGRRTSDKRSLVKAESGLGRRRGVASSSGILDLDIDTQWETRAFIGLKSVNRGHSLA